MQGTGVKVDMSESGRFSTHHVPDDGARFAPGDIVRIDQSVKPIAIVKDPLGDYQVASCRPATEFTGDTPLLRVGLRKIERQQADANPWDDAEPVPVPEWLRPPNRRGG